MAKDLVPHLGIGFHGLPLHGGQWARLVQHLVGQVHLAQVMQVGSQLEALQVGKATASPNLRDSPTTLCTWPRVSR